MPYGPILHVRGASLLSLPYCFREFGLAPVRFYTDFHAYGSGKQILGLCNPIPGPPTL